MEGTNPGYVGQEIPPALALKIVPEHEGKMCINSPALLSMPHRSRLMPLSPQQGVPAPAVLPQPQVGSQSL